MAEDPVDAAAEALYGVPLSTFVAERKRLADEAKARGEKKEAAAIAKLAKPSVSAWVVNMLLREGALGDLFAAAKRVRAGGFAAQADQRAAIAQLRARATQVLEGDKHAASPAVIQRITTTLHALAASGTFAPDAPGRLTADRDPPGFEAMAGVTMQPATSTSTPAPAPATSPPVTLQSVPMPAPEPRPPAVDRTKLQRLAAAARQVVADRRGDLMRARAELTLAEAAAGRLRERVAGIQDELAEAEARAAEAEAALE